MKESSGTTQGLWQLLLPHKPKKSAFVYLALLVIGATVLELVLPLYSSYLVDSIGNDGIETFIIIGLIAIVLTTAVLEAFLGWYGGKMGHTISLNLRYSLIGRLLNGQTQSMDQEHSAELSARVINDSKEVKSVLAEDLIGLLSGIISLIAVITIMFILDWRLTLVLVSCVLAGFIIITPIALMMNNIGQEQQTAEANLLKYITEWLRYGKLIRSHNAANQMQKQSRELLDKSFKHEMRATKVMSLIGPIANLVLMISMIAILAYSAFWLKQGTLTLGTITAFLLYLFGLIFPLMSMAMFFSNLNKAAGAASRLSEIDKFAKEPVGSDIQIDEIASLSVRDLSFSRNDKDILKAINYQFEGHGLSVLLGESGSGKSTFLSLFLGFYPETFGHVFLNDKPLSAYNLLSVRQAIAWVDQEPKLLHATVYENLTLGLTENIGSNRILEVLQSVGLHAWLTRIENNLDLVVSEQAHQFSGGEKQRFAIARAILRQSKVLLLDEPTSALDDVNKKELMVLLRQLATTMRVIIISHHLDLIEPSDDVIEMVAGEIVPKLV
ncbi:MAG: ABC transporter ATP-binding protein [Thalassotalea sp.]|nr:ABC transporter ATP-binding protein [Thalassotalea sp.]